MITQEISNISTLADAPNPLTDTQEVFDSKGYAYTQSQATVNAEMQTVVGELNTFADQVNTTQEEINTARDEAVSAASTASMTANAESWVSGHSYLINANAISLVNHKTYRAKNATSGTTDPSLDKDEKKKIKKQLLDICKTIPSLTIFLLPGGGLLLPILIKFIPTLLLSSFNENIDD